MNFYVFLSQILFLFAGYVLSLFLKNNINPVYVDYSKILSLIIISYIAFLSSLEFKIKKIRNIHPYNRIISLISIIIISIILFIFYSFIEKKIEPNTIYIFLFASGSAFTFIPFKKDKHMNRIVLTGILSPLYYSILYIVIYSIYAVLFHKLYNIVFLLIFALSLYILIKYIIFLHTNLDYKEWTILILGLLLIITPFALKFQFIPFVSIFIFGFLLTNYMSEYTRFFLLKFHASLKPLYFILLFIAGFFMEFFPKIIIVFICILLIKIIIQYFIYSKFLLIKKFHFLYTGISGIEFIAAFSLYIMEIINIKIFTGFIIFILISQLIQMVSLNVYNNK